MLKNIFLIGCMLTALGGYAQTGTNPKGSLFIIGGGNRSDALMQQLVEAAAINDKDYIIVLPMSSEQPDAGFDYFSKQMNRLTGAFIRNFDYKKHDVSDPIWADSLAKAKLIYILGGDQSRFMKVVLNTPVYAAIHKAFANGATIAGTSAGAAVMSRYMITGRQLRDTVYKETFDKLWDSNIEFTEGLGLLQHTIIDQHFLKRNRYNRLVTALADKPGYTCVGIDESTAILVRGNKATVVGESQVLRFVVPKGAAIGKVGKGLLKFEQINLGIYTAGDIMEIQP